MTAEIELLPMPEGEASSFGNYEVHDNEAMIEYARANIARAVAPSQAEIERLQAKVERLTEALRELEGCEQRNEALLRQALEALERGETKLRFAAIAALKERLK